jgi:hypothetical protein
MSKRDNEAFKAAFEDFAKNHPTMDCYAMQAFAEGWIAKRGTAPAAPDALRVRHVLARRARHWEWMSRRRMKKCGQDGLTIHFESAAGLYNALLDEIDAALGTRKEGGG